MSAVNEHPAEVRRSCRPQKGDVILRADRTAITSSKVLHRYLGTLTSNQRSVFAVARGGKTVDVEVVMPATLTAVAFVPTAGATDIDSELLARLKVQEELLVKALAELQSLRAELKARP